MNKNVLLISATPRRGGNSEILADAFIKGVQESGNQAEKITLYDKNIQFCKGCLSCQKTGKCIIQDDVNAILEKMEKVDVIVYATPIYFYQMCGQLKTLLDRSNPLFTKAYPFRDIYLLTSAADSDIAEMASTTIGIQGWIDCFEKTQLKGVINAMSVTDVNDIKAQSNILQEAYEMGKRI